MQKLAYDGALRYADSNANGGVLCTLPMARQKALHAVGLRDLQNMI